MNHVQFTSRTVVHTDGGVSLAGDSELLLNKEVLNWFIELLCLLKILFLSVKISIIFVLIQAARIRSELLVLGNLALGCRLQVHRRRVVAKGGLHH